MWPDHPASSFSLISTSRCPRPPPVPPAPLGLRSWHPRERGSPWMWRARLGQEPEGCPGAHLMGFWRDPALSAAAGGRVRGRLFRRLVSSCTTLSIFLRLGSCCNYNVLFISFQTLLFCGNDSEPHWSILRLSWWTLQTRYLHGVCWLTPWILWGLLRPLHQTSVTGDVTRMSLGIWNNISPVPTNQSSLRPVSQEGGDLVSAALDQPQTSRAEKRHAFNCWNTPSTFPMKACHCKAQLCTGQHAFRVTYSLLFLYQTRYLVSSLFNWWDEAGFILGCHPSSLRLGFSSSWASSEDRDKYLVFTRTRCQLNAF